MTEKLSGSDAEKVETTPSERPNGEILEEIQALPIDKQVELTEKLEMYSGPIPHPSILEAFDKLYPGSAKKMINNGIQESRHRRGLENVRTYGKMLLSYFFVILFYVGLFAFMYGCFILVIKGHKWVGGTGGIVAFFGLFSTIMNIVEGLTSKDDYKNQ